MKCLKEWVDAKGNKATFSNNTTNTTSKCASASNKIILDTFLKEISQLHNNTKGVQYHYYGNIVDVTVYDMDPRYADVPMFGFTFNLDTGDYDILVDPNEYFGNWERVKGNSISNLINKYCNTSAYLGIPYLSYKNFKNKLPAGVVIESLNEWVDAKGNKISSNKPASQPTTNNPATDVVYIWDMYIDPRDKGTWCSAEEYNGEYDGSVFKTKEAAYNEGKIHLYELEDEGQLRGDPEDYDIEVRAIPKNKVSDYTLEFSGIK